MRLSLFLKLAFLFLIALEQNNINAQNLSSARKTVDTLTSSYFSGRGAANDGELKAASFLKKEFIKIGLTPFNQRYLQPFESPINTFNGDCNVKIDNKNLIAGKDYLVGAKSGKIHGDFNLIWYNKDNSPTKKQLKTLAKRNFFENKFIVIDDRDIEKGNEVFELLKLNIFDAAGIIILVEEKLTHSLASTFVNYGIIKILRNKISRSSKKISIDLEQTFVRNYESQNIIGYSKGTLYPDSFIVFSAHYDHLGTMGRDVFFPGANDNASGIAMMLELAKHYTKHSHEKSIVFMAFGAEEAGIVGSKYFTENPTFSLSKIIQVINVDIMGTGDEGITIVNGTLFPHKYDLLTRINVKNNYLSSIKKRGKAKNSDHYWFTEKGVPAFFIYARGGISAYHDIYDISKTLPLSKFENCFLLIKDFVNEL